MKMQFADVDGGKFFDMYACRGVGAAVLSDSQKAEFRRRHQALLANFPPQFQIPHWVSILDFQKNNAR